MTTVGTNRIRRIIPSLDNASDILVLTDEPTVAIYNKRPGVTDVSAVRSSEEGGEIVPLYTLRKERRPHLPNSPMDAVWCPYKRGDVNSSYLVTGWGSAIRLVDVEDGLLRAGYYVGNTMDEVCYAQSLLWLRSPNRQEQFIGGYGRSLECCVALFDVMREGKNPLFTYEPTAAKCCNYSADAASSAVIVSALAEVRNNLIAFGTLRGSLELVDLRSRCCAGSVGGWTANGAGNVIRGAAAGANFTRHTSGIVQIISLDGPTLSLNTPSLVPGGVAAAVAAQLDASTTNNTAFPTASDDHRFITVARAGDDNILVWDMRNLTNPTAVIQRGATLTNTLRNVAIVGKNIVVPTQREGLSCIPMSAVFGNDNSEKSEKAAVDADVSTNTTTTRTISALDFFEHGLSVLEVSPVTNKQPIAVSTLRSCKKNPADDDEDNTSSATVPTPPAPASSTIRFAPKSSLQKKAAVDDGICPDTSTLIGPIAAVGDTVVIATRIGFGDVVSVTSGGALYTAASNVSVVKAEKGVARAYLATETGYAKYLLAGGKRGRSGAAEDQVGAADGKSDNADAEACGESSSDSDEDYVLVRSRRAFNLSNVAGTASKSKVELSDDDE